ncbi:MAG: choice-of-anchor tandem repeat GloVer-containing protein, partial [Lentisphaerota bacterium]
MKKMLKYFAASTVLGLAFLRVSLAATGDLQVLHAFAPSTQGGSRPTSAPIEQAGILYGMTPYGGVSNYGVIYSVRLSDLHYTNLYAFRGPDGQHPFGSLLGYAGQFYGMTSQGGTNEDGVIFRISPAGGDYTILHQFNDQDEMDGAAPWSSLVESNGVLYGTTYNGGTNNRGVVFSLLPDGSGYTNLHRFRGGAADGKHSKGDLLVDGSMLYGMTCEGGGFNAGTVFAMGIDGQSFTNLVEFTGMPGNGRNPCGRLAKIESTLYGLVHSTEGNAGSIFGVSTEGGAASFLKAFSGGVDDGGVPEGSLTRYASKLFGMTR